jgi:hypothetical protein
MFLVKKKTQDTNRLDYEGFEPTIWNLTLN